MSSRPKQKPPKQHNPQEQAPSPRGLLAGWAANHVANNMSDPKAKQARAVGKALVQQEAQEQGAEEGPDKYPVPKKVITVKPPSSLPWFCVLALGPLPRFPSLPGDASASR